MPVAPADPLVVTARLDDATHDVLDALRREHFPPQRNHLRAHLTLFHALPGEEHEAVLADMREVAGGRAPIEATLPGPMKLGTGTAIRVEAPGLAEVRGELARRWSFWLTPQDRGGFRPHVTVQNKVGADVASTLHDALAADWEPRRARIVGLQLWHYRGGPWEPAGDAGFAA